MSHAYYTNRFFNITFQFEFSVVRVRSFFDIKGKTFNSSSFSHRHFFLKQLRDSIAFFLSYREYFSRLTYQSTRILIKDREIREKY